MRVHRYFNFSEEYLNPRVPADKRSVFMLCGGAGLLNFELEQLRMQPLRVSVWIQTPAQLSALAAKNASRRAVTSPVPTAKRQIFDTVQFKSVRIPVYVTRHMPICPAMVHPPGDRHTPMYIVRCIS